MRDFDLLQMMTMTTALSLRMMMKNTDQLQIG